MNANYLQLKFLYWRLRADWRSWSRGPRRDLQVLLTFELSISPRWLMLRDYDICLGVPRWCAAYAHQAAAVCIHLNKRKNLISSLTTKCIRVRVSVLIKRWNSHESFIQIQLCKFCVLILLMFFFSTLLGGGLYLFDLEFLMTILSFIYKYAR